MPPKRARAPRKPTLVQSIRRDLKAKRQTLKRQLKVVVRDLKSVGVKGAAKRGIRRGIGKLGDKFISSL